MSFTQEYIAGAVTGAGGLFLRSSCRVVSPLPQLQAQHTHPNLNRLYSSSQTQDYLTPTPTRSPLELMPGQVGEEVNNRVAMTLLTGVEFSAMERIKATETTQGAIMGSCEGIAVCPGATASLSSSSNSNGPVSMAASLLRPPCNPHERKRWSHYIYGSVSTQNAVVPVLEKKSALVRLGTSGGVEGDEGGEVRVNVLQVRRKM